MTTIAWDGQSIAADGWAITSMGFRRLCHKLYVGGGFVYGGTGDLTETIEIANWIAAGRSEDKCPKFDEEVSGIAVDQTTGQPWLVLGKRPMFCPLLSAFHSCGSGRDFAIAAMALGKSAKDAVELSSRFDAFTGPQADVIAVPRWAPPARSTDS